MATYEEFALESGKIARRLALPGGGAEWGTTLAGTTWHKFVKGNEGYLHAACRRTTRPHLHPEDEFVTRRTAEGESGSVCGRCAAKDDAQQTGEWRRVEDSHDDTRTSYPSAREALAEISYAQMGGRGSVREMTYVGSVATIDYKDGRKVVLTRTGSAYGRRA